MNSLANQIMKVSRRNRKSPAIGRFGGDAGDVIVKRLTLPGVLLNTVVGTGVIGVGTFNSGECQSAPASEFASFAARYQQYRVRSLKLVGKAMHPTCDAVVSQHSCLYLSDFIGSSAPSTAAQVLSDEGSRQVETCKDFTFSTTWARNPNAKLGSDVCRHSYCESVEHSAGWRSRREHDSGCGAADLHLSSRVGG